MTTPELPDTAEPVPPPPAPYYYGPSSPQVPSRTLWFGIGAGTVLGVLILGFGSLTLYAFVASDPSGKTYYVNQSSVVNAVEEPCQTLRTAAAEIELFDDPKAASEDIKAVVEAAQGIIRAIYANEPNRDSRLWRDDWKLLAANLDDYANDLAELGKNAEFASPMSEVETPVMARMSHGSDASCDVPQVIEAMDPLLDDYYDGYYY